MWLLDLLELVPILRWLLRRILGRNMEIEIKKPYSKATPNTLPAMISEKPIINVYVGPNPHIYMWADLVFTNHRTDRREFILDATLHLKKKHWILWHKTLAEAPIRVHTAVLESRGPLLENLAIEPMSSPITKTVDARGPITIPPRCLPKRMVLCIEFRMIGPLRRIRRIVDRVNHNPKQLTSDREGSQTE